MANTRTLEAVSHVRTRLFAKAVRRSAVACLATLGSLGWAIDFDGPPQPRSNQECSAYAFRALAQIHREFNESNARCEQLWEGGNVATQSQLKHCYREASDKRSSLENALNRERSRCADKVMASRY